jgi:hypothetical protein
MPSHSATGPVQNTWEELGALGVIPENIFHRSWNHRRDEDPFSAPDVDVINDQTNSRSEDPSYLAIIG